MEEIEGRVTEINYQNVENRNSVFDIFTEGETVTCIGKAPEMTIGMKVRVTGEHIENAPSRKRILIRKFEVISAIDD